MTKEKSLSGFEKKVFDILSCIVTGQTMNLKDDEGNIWESKCRIVEDLSMTTITKNKKVWATLVYNIETSEEKVFFSSEKVTKED